MLIIGCSGALKLAKNIAKVLDCEYSGLFTDKFPDGETRVRFETALKNEEVVLVQSFYKNINDKLIEVFFAAHTAKDLGAKKVILIAPYFPYMRQDKRFNDGEAISIEVVSKLIKTCIDKIVILDPHLHRKNKLTDIFTIEALKLTAYPLIAEYIKENFIDENPVIIGPDEESYKWAQATAETIGCEYSILEKTRHDARNVEVNFKKKIALRGRNVIIVDDMISTGHTVIETIKKLKTLKVKSIRCICIHGIFIEKALKKISSYGVEVISSNSIPNPVGKIDVSWMIATRLQEL